MSQELKVVKKFVSWNDFPNYITNSIFRKTIQTHEDKSEPNRTAKQKELVVIYFCFPYYEYKGLQLLKYFIRKIKLNCKNDRPAVFKILYDACDFEFFCNLCMSSRVLAVLQITWEKPKERYINNVLNRHGVIKTVLWKITSTSVLKCSTYLILPV